MSDVTPSHTSFSTQRDAPIPANQAASDELKPFHEQFAKSLHKTAFIYALYGAVDGLSLSYSMVKYYFDAFCADKNALSSDLMHEWMTTPSGALIVATEAVTIIGFSLIANVCKANDPNAAKRFIATVWPYMRDGMKAVKNAYKGVRSTFVAASLFPGLNVNNMIIPTGILLGCISAANRLWYRQMKNARKDMMEINDKILEQIKKMDHWEVERCDLVIQFIPPDKEGLDTYPIPSRAAYVICEGKLYYINKVFKQCIHIDKTPEEIIAIQNHFHASTKPKSLSSEEIKILEKQSGQKHTSLKETIAHQRQFLDSNRNKGLASQFFSGFIDGLYLYMGVLGLSAFAPPVFIPLAVLCVVFTAACMATRVYEEYDYQKQLKLSQQKIEFAICGKELEGLCHNAIQALCDDSQEETFEESKQQNAKKALIALESKYKELLSKRKTLAEQMTLTSGAAALTGLQYGLSAYSAIASVLFAAATICAIFFTAFPPAIVISAAVMGLVCVLGFTVFSIYRNHHHSELVRERVINKKPKQLVELLEKLKRIEEDTHKEINKIPPSQVKEAITEGMVVDPSPQFFFQELFEVVRSFFSGINKGQKSVGYTLNSLQEQDEQGHYHDSPIMLWFGVITSALFSIVLALRALAKGFGKEKLGSVSLASDSSSAVKANTGRIEDVVLGEAKAKFTAVKPEASPPAETSKSEAPKPGAAKPEAPKSEAPKPEAPKSEAPKPEAPKPEAPKSEAPKSEAPKPEAPKQEVAKPNKDDALNTSSLPGASPLLANSMWKKLARKLARTTSEGNLDTLIEKGCSSERRPMTPGPTGISERGDTALGLM